MPSIFSSRQKAKKPPKKAPRVISYDKDVICLLRCYAEKCASGIPIPRGKARAKLCKMGLVGKLHLNSDMEESEILAETRSVFHDAMDGDGEFPFSFLQIAGGGTKTLAKPKLSLSFRWNAKQVMGLGQSTIYILADRELQCEKVYKVHV